MRANLKSPYQRSSQTSYFNPLCCGWGLIDSPVLKLLLRDNAMVDQGQNHVFTKSLQNTVLLGFCRLSVCPSDILKTNNSMTTYSLLYPVALTTQKKHARGQQLSIFTTAFSSQLIKPSFIFMNTVANFMKCPKYTQCQF